MKMAEAIQTMHRNLESDRQTAAETATVDLAYRTIMRSKKAGFGTQKRAQLYELAEFAENGYSFTCGTIYDLNHVEKAIGFILMVLAIEVAFTIGAIALVGLFSVVSQNALPDWVVITLIAIWGLTTVIGGIAFTYKTAIPWCAVHKVESRRAKLQKFMEENAAAHRFATTQTIRQFKNS